MLRTASAMLVGMMFAGSLSALAQDVSQVRQKELDYLLRQDCGSCHGMTLKGGLGPKLRSENLHDRDVDQIVEIILSGVPGTPMPPWGSLLSREDARWLAERIIKGKEE